MRAWCLYPTSNRNVDLALTQVYILFLGLQVKTKTVYSPGLEPNLVTLAYGLTYGGLVGLQETARSAR